MNRQSFSLLLFILCSFQLFAQDDIECYKKFLNEGIAAFDQLNFETAVKKFEAARICDDIPGDNNNIEEWLEKARNGYIDSILEAKQETEEQREKLERSNAKVARLILQNVNKDILKLDYPTALENIKAAASLGALKEEVAKSYLELAFWFGESGQVQRAAGILDSAAQLANNAAVPELLQALPQDPATAKEKIRDAIKLLDKVTFDRLWARYYPEMIEVEGGTFQMGSKSNNYPVSVSSFFIAKYETTWWQYALFCQATGRKYERPGWGTDGDNPVVNVSWYDAVEYANWLSQVQGNQLYYGIDKSRKDPKNEFEYDNLKYLVTPDESSNGFRLPTEAEWEYAARGGQEGKNNNFTYAGSNEVDEVAWTANNARNRTQPVMEKKANELDLYDMSGNVWDWCWDWYDKEYYKKSNNAHDPQGPDSGSRRVSRGGSWRNDYASARCSRRFNYVPNGRGPDIGFRLARTGG